MFYFKRSINFSYCFAINIIFCLYASTTIAQSCPPAKVVLEPFDYTICNTGSAFFYIKANDASRYQWQVNAGAGWVDLSNDANYTGVTKDSLFINLVSPNMASNLFRCEVFSTCGNDTSFPGALKIIIPQPPVANISHINTSECTGVPVGYLCKTLRGGPNPVYNWKINGQNAGSNINTFVSANLKEGDIISCVLTSNATCITNPVIESNKDTVHFSATVLPKVDIIQADTVLCEGNTAPTTFTVLVTNGGIDPDFKWMINGKVTGLNSNILSTVGLKSGDTLRIFMTSKNPCANPVTVVSKDMVLDISPTFISTASISTTDTIICAGQNISFTCASTNSGSGVIFNWFINDKLQSKSDSTFSTKDLREGDKVTCLLTSKTPCFRPLYTNPITMHVKDGPEIMAPPDTLIIVGNSVQLIPVIKGTYSTLDWQPATYLDQIHIVSPISTPLHTITYTLKATSPTGCAVSAKTTIKVIDHVIVPNIFTPNNDGINDKWEIQGLPTYKDCKIQVFNRYGQLVFNSNGYDMPWDGKNNGRPLPSGTYYYIIETKTDKKLFTGYVVILR